MPNEYDDILPPLSSEDKMMAGSCYPFWPVVPLFVLASSKRQDPFLAFHAVQALAVGLTGAALSVVGMFMLWVTFSSLPTSWMMTSGALGILLVFAAMAFGGFCFLTSIFLGWQAASGRFLRVAGLGDLCEARMASLLGLSAAELRKLAVDRELMPEEMVTVLAPVATPEQMQAEMEHWAQPAATAKSWWGAGQAPQAGRETQQMARETQQMSRETQDMSWEPEAAPVQQVKPWQPAPAQRPATSPEVKPWRPAAAQQPAAPAAPVQRTASGAEVKPWRPAQAQSTPAARPVSFPSVNREVTEEKKKWWTPKEG